MVKVFILVLCLCFSVNFVQAKDASKIYIYNWSNYIPLSVIQEFQKKTGIKVVYDVYDTEEMLDAKLISGDTGYDLVFPTNGLFLGNQIKMKLYKELSSTEARNRDNIDSKILKVTEHDDPENKYTIPFMMTVTGIGYNVKQIESIDRNAPLNSLKLVFDPQYAKKFAKCGIAWFNFPAEIMSLAILYNGDDLNNIDDQTLERASATLKAVRKYVKYILPSDVYSDNLANGSICLALGWTGEMAQSKEKLKVAGGKDNIKYVYPIEGSILSIDSMAIPRTSSNPNVYKFIDFLLDTKIAKTVSKHSKHISPIKELSISDREFSKMHVMKAQPINILRKRNRLWNNILTDTD